MLKPLLALTAASVACASAAHSAEPARPQPRLNPLDFFTGATRGEGTIKVITKDHRSVSVESHGTPDNKGGLTLDQKIREEGRPPRNRRWVLRPTSKSTLAGIATDAAGTVTGELEGNRLHLKYKMKSGLWAEQWMYLQPDRRTMRNYMTVRKLGIVVARVEETIRKLP